MTDPDAQRPWGTLALVVVAQFMVVVDLTIVNVALPSINDSLHFGRANLEWVITAYALCTGGLVLIGGRAADHLGRRRVFLAGLLTFTAASLASGLAPSSGFLIGSRVGQGIGAAAMAPSALSIITATYAGAQRATALGVWSAISSGAVAVGVIAGGALTSLLSWRWVFLVNLPVGVATMAISARTLPSSLDHSGGRSGTLDLPGAASAAGGFAMLVYALSGAPTHGWGSARTLALLGGGAGLLVVFAVIEQRAGDPLVPPAVWHERALITGAGMILGISGLIVGSFFLLSVYIQNVLGWSPLHTGLGLLPFVGAMALGVRTASGLIGKAGSRPLIMTGMALVAAGATLLAALTGHGGTYAGDLLPGLLVLGVGVGFAFPATTITAMHATSAETAGLASGLTATARELGSAVGVAVLGAVAAGATTIATGDRSAFMVAAVISAALVAIAATLIPSIKPTAGQAAPTHAPSGPVTPHQ